METLTLEEAAELLKMHPATLQEKARSGEIPGAKPGKCWVFVDVDLIEYIRSKYKRRALQSEQTGNSLCHSSSGKIRPTIGSKSQSVDEKYNEALGRTTKPKPKNSTID